MRYRRESRTTKAAPNNTGSEGKGFPYACWSAPINSETAKAEFPPRHLIKPNSHPDISTKARHTVTRVEFRVCDPGHVTV